MSHIYCISELLDLNRHWPGHRGILPLIISTDNQPRSALRPSAGRAETPAAGNQSMPESHKRISDSSPGIQLFENVEQMFLFKFDKLDNYVN